MEFCSVEKKPEFCLPGDAVLQQQDRAIILAMRMPPF